MLTVTICVSFLSISWCILAKVGRKSKEQSLWHPRKYGVLPLESGEVRSSCSDRCDSRIGEGGILWDFYILGKIFYIICDFFGQQSCVY